MDTATLEEPQIRIAPQHGRQRLFLQSSADITVYGGSAGGGKTFGLLLEPLYHVEVEGFNAVIFRRTYPQIMNAGALWDESKEIYPHVRPRPIPKIGNLSWTFPFCPERPADVTFRSMQLEDTKYDWDGAQVCLLEFDQLEQFTEGQFFYMLSRNRSTCGVKPYIRATANPQPGWLADFISWWIDPDDGYAILERSGQLRYMVRLGDTIRWADKAQTLIDKYGPDCLPKSVTFIPASVYDNKILMQKDPGYLANLQALPELERKRLLGDKLRGGNWHIRPGGTKFKREWFRFVPEAPADLQAVVRFWDMAATEEAPGKDPDFTAGAKVGYKDGQFFIMDMQHDRLSPEGNEKLVRNTAVVDGYEVAVRMELEGGSSGKAIISHYARNIMTGFNFLGDSVTKSKSIRANPLSAAVESGNVFLVEGAWNKNLLDELESFSDDCEHDDQVDACSGAHKYLTLNFIDPHISGHTDPHLGRLLNRQDEIFDEIIENLSDEDKVLADKMIREAGL